MGGGMPMGALSPLQGLTNLLGQPVSPSTGGSVTGSEAGGRSGLGVENGTEAAAIPVGGGEPGQAGLSWRSRRYRQYLGKALDTMGITDPVARANWTRG